MSVNGINKKRSDYTPEVGFMNNPDGYASLKGSCGDTIAIWLRIADNRIMEATYDTDGCYPSIISGKAAAQLAQGRILEDAYQIEKTDIIEVLGGWLPDEFHHCAHLAAETLKEAIGDYYKKEITNDNHSGMDTRYGSGENRSDKNSQDCEERS